MVQGLMDTVGGGTGLVCICFRAKRGHLRKSSGLEPESQGQNLA